MKFQVLIDGKVYEVEAETDDDQAAPVSSVAVPAVGAIQSASMTESACESDASQPDDLRRVCSPVAGIVAQSRVNVGQNLEKGELLLVIEAMKMETRITAPANVRVKSLSVAPGDAVKVQQVLAEFE